MLELLASFTYEPVQRWGPVSPHGVGTALGFFLGAWLMAKRAEAGLRGTPPHPRGGIPRTEVYNAVTWGAVGAIIGARGFYVLGHLSEFHSVMDMLALWKGGLTMFGGFVGGLLLGLGYLRRHGFDIPTALDAAAPGFVVGVMVGRLGDIAIADHLGHVTGLPFGYEIPNAPLAPGYGPPTYVPGAIVHHTAVYDLIGALVLFAALYWLERRRPRAGTLFATFCIWYGLQRFVIDFTRNREQIESFFAGLSGSQWAGLAFALAGVVWLTRLRTTPQPAEPPPGELAPSLVARPELETSPEPAPEPEPHPSSVFATSEPDSEPEPAVAYSPLPPSPQTSSETHEPIGEEPPPFDPQTAHEGPGRPGEQPAQPADDS